VAAEDYERTEFAVREDKLRRVRVKNLALSAEVKRSEVIFLQYGNEELSTLVDSLFGVYGEWIARLFQLQKMKGQLRVRVNVDGTFLKTEYGQKTPQKCIDRTYNAIRGRAHAIVPQQKGMEYEEHSRNNA